MELSQVGLYARIEPREGGKAAPPKSGRKESMDLARPVHGCSSMEEGS